MTRRKMSKSFKEALGYYLMMTGLILCAITASALITMNCIRSLPEYVFTFIGYATLFIALALAIGTVLIT